MFDKVGRVLPGKGFPGIQAPGNCDSIYPGFPGGLEIPDLVTNVEDFMRHEGKGAGNGAQVFGLAAKLSNTADKGKLSPETTSQI